MFRFSFAVIACAVLMVTSIGCGGPQSSSENLGSPPTTTEEMEKRMQEMQSPDYEKMKQVSGSSEPGSPGQPPGQ